MYLKLFLSSLFCVIVSSCTNEQSSVNTEQQESLQLNGDCSKFHYDSSLMVHLSNGLLDSVKNDIDMCASLKSEEIPTDTTNYYRAAWGNDSIVIYLLANGADTNKAVYFAGMDMFEYAIYDNRTLLIDYMLKQKYIPGADAIAYAAANNDPQLLDTLMKMGLDLDSARWLDGNYPILSYLCSNYLTREEGAEYIPIAEKLLDAGIDPTISMNGVTDCAPNAGHDALYSCVGNLTKKTDSLLLPIIKKMVKNGADPLRPACLYDGRQTNALQQSFGMPLIHSFLDSISKIED